jgi:hypothetical protein
MPLLISVPCLGLSLAAAIYGFWPWLRGLPSRPWLDRLAAVLETGRLQIRAWSVSTWEHPREAAERFGPGDILSDGRNADEAIRRGTQRHWEIRGKMSEAMKTMPRITSPMTIPEPEEMEGLRAQLQECQKQVEDAQRDSNSAARDHLPLSDCRSQCGGAALKRASGSQRGCSGRARYTTVPMARDDA